MEDATFILKDVIYIVVGVASALGFYWKMIISDNRQDDKIRQMKKDIDRNEGVMFKKFAAIHARMEKNEEKTKETNDTFNKEISEVKMGISTINGKLDILIKNNV